MKEYKSASYSIEGTSLPDNVENLQDEIKQDFDTLSLEMKDLNPLFIKSMLSMLGFFREGENLKESIKSFQRKYNLVPDGIVGFKTEKVLKKVYNHSVSQHAYIWEGGSSNAVLGVSAPDYNTMYLENQQITLEHLEKKYGICIKVDHREFYDTFVKGQQPLNLNKKLKELDIVLANIYLSDNDKKKFRLVLIPRDEFTIRGQKGRGEKLKSAHDTRFDFCIPYQSTPNAIKEGINKFLEKIKFSLKIIPQKHNAIDYDTFFDDPAVDMALHIPNDWIESVENASSEEVRLWLARSLHLSGFTGIPNQKEVSEQMQIIQESREYYKSVPLFYNRNVITFAGKASLNGLNKDNKIFISPDEKQNIDNQKPKRHILLRECDYRLNTKPMLKDYIINTPPPACFYLNAHGSAERIYINESVFVSHDEMMEWMCMRYENYPALLNANTSMQDLIILHSCNGHTFFRSLYQNLEKLYQGVSLPIAIVAGEYGQLMFSGIEHNYQTDFTLTSFGTKGIIRLGDVMKQNQCKRKLNSPTVYVPLGKGLRDKLKVSGIKQLTSRTDFLLEYRQSKT